MDSVYKMSLEIVLGLGLGGSHIFTLDALYICT